MGKPSLFISAGDVSGDNATGRVVSILKDKYSDIELFGLGGRRLRELGQEQFAEPSELSVMGFWEVARRYFFFRMLFEKCILEIEKRQPSAVLLVDYPGFNLRLAKKVKSLGIPVVYYISPQVWAWGKRRVSDIRDYVDLMLLILPFEENFYRGHGVNAKFVGHYLLEDIPPEYVQSEPVKSGQVGILPGSRRQEVERMLPGMLGAARRLHSKNGTTAVVAGITGLCDYKAMISRFGGPGVSLVLDDARRVIHESQVILIASGTATLETGIIGRPMVIVYKTGFITYQIARWLVKLEMIGLVNLVLGERVMPELIQRKAKPGFMAAEVGRLLRDESYRSEVKRKLRGVPDLLGGSGASARTAEIVGQFL